MKNRQRICSSEPQRFRLAGAPTLDKHQDQQGPTEEGRFLEPASDLRMKTPWGSAWASVCLPGSSEDSDYDRTWESLGCRVHMGKVEDKVGKAAWYQPPKDTDFQNTCGLYSLISGCPERPLRNAVTDLSGAQR